MSETKVAEPVGENTATGERGNGREAGQPRARALSDVQAAREALARRWPGQVQLTLENLASLIFALLLSLFIWVVAVNEQNPPREDYYPGDIPIELVNFPPSLVLFQPIERAARVRIRASQSSWERLQAGSARAYIDMSGATSGLHEFDVKVEFSDPNIVMLSVDPQRIAVRLEELREKTLSVQVNAGGNPPVGYAVGTPEAKPQTVRVSGAQSQVDKVAEVVAALQVGGSKSSVEKEVALVARDAQGSVVTGVRLSPSSAVVTVPVEQRLGFKDVSVKVVTKGNVASGYWLSNITVDPNLITVSGKPERLDEIGGFIPTETIDVKDAKTSSVRRVNLVLPEGVSPVSVQGVLVTIDISPIQGGQTVQRQVTVQGSDRALKVSLSPETVDVILSGPLPVLQALKLEDVQVIIDLVNRGPGKYKITPTVVKPDSLKVESLVPDTIEVSISK